MKSIKKPIIVVLAIISVIAIAGGIFIFSRSPKTAYDFIVAKKTQ